MTSFRICVVGQTSGIFHKLTFTLLGFDTDAVAYQMLADVVQDNGGVCLS